MDQISRQQAQSAIEAFDAAISQGSKVRHEQIAEAVRRLIALRNQLLDRTRAGDIEGVPLKQVNALVSLAHGAEHPLIGVHLHRMEQARDGLRTLVTRTTAEGD